MNDLARFASVLSEELRPAYPTTGNWLDGCQLRHALKRTADRLHQSPEESDPRLTSLLSALERIAIAASMGIDGSGSDNIYSLSLIHDTANKALAEQTTSKV